MKHIYSYHIKPNTLEADDCSRLCKHSTQLYNACVSAVKEFYKEHKSLYYVEDEKKKFVYKYVELYHLHKDSPLFKTVKHEDYVGDRINTKVLKQVYMQVNEAFSSYKTLKSKWDFAKKMAEKDKKDFTKPKPRLPKVKSKENEVTFPLDAYSVSKDGTKLTLSMTNITLDITCLKGLSLREVKIIPSTYGYIITVLYEDSLIVDELDLDNISIKDTKVAGIDLGMNNFCSISFNVSEIKPWLINGRNIKSVNQYYNKRLAKMKSELPNKVKSSKRIRKLTQKRNFKMKDMMHNVSKHIVSELFSKGVEILVVGNNKRWKNRISLGKKTNQNFVSIPYYKFKQMLKHKCAEYGIHYIEREENYTSKCSFLDMEDICKHDTYKGERVMRGLFKSSNGVCVNADINGSLNIIRKEFGNDIFPPNLIDLFSNIKRITI